MPTTFNVLSLGVQSDIDTVEGNNEAEGASSLVGITFGGPQSSLANNIREFTPGSTGFTGGTNNAYDMNNNVSSETFSIDGGPDQTFDGTAIYNATITYIDGSTAQITAVIFQDTAGNTYLAPEFSANADQTALEAAPLRSLTLDSVNTNTNLSGLTANRQTFTAVTCFTKGVLLTTPSGNVKIEDLCVGDEVTTADCGAQKIRWIGTASRPATGSFVPVRIKAGALGSGLPRRDLLVSQQHRILIRSAIARRIMGNTEVLVAAKKLTVLDGVEFADDLTEVEYYHILLDQHQIIFAEGAPSETLLTGAMALQSVGQEALDEINQLFPELLETAATPARMIPKGGQLRNLIMRHSKNTRPAIDKRAYH